MTEFDPRWAEFATPTQRKYLALIAEHGTARKVEIALGLGNDTVQKSIRALKRAAAVKGYSPEHDMTRPAPAGFAVKGTSTYYNEDGKPVGQWVKTTRDQAQVEALMREGFAAMAEELPRLLPVVCKSDQSPHLCNVYTLTDSHVGSLCWHREGGDDWDLKIAERVLVGCFEKMLLASPNAGTCVVAQLGDFLHADGMTPVTPTSGHVLDADGRFSKVVAVAIRVLRRVVDMALLKHQKVIVLMAEGNHDITSSIWLRAMFAAIYENEPRVEVIDSPLPFYVYQHGKTMLGWHHGHLMKPAELPLLFAAQFPAVWGTTTKRYIHTGHRHHVEVKEHSGVTVQQHSTLTGRDAYSARNGYVNDRQVTAVCYHDNFGVHSTATICPEMLA